MGDNGWSWEKTYAALCAQGFKLGDMPSSNIVWGSFLEENGFEYHSLLRKCLECYSVADFCADNPVGKFVVGTDTHAIAIVDSNVWDIFDSQDMYPTYYFKKHDQEENNNG